MTIPSNWRDYGHMVHFLPHDAMLARYIPYSLVSVLSVTSRCSIKTAKRRIAQTTPHDSPVNLIFCCLRSRQNSNGVTPPETPNAGGVGYNWQLSTNNSL